MHFKNALNPSIYKVFRAFFTQSPAKLRFNVFFPPFPFCVGLFVTISNQVLYVGDSTPAATTFSYGQRRKCADLPELL